MIIKVLGPQISITSANTVANSTLVRVVNPGALAVLNIGSVGNVSVSNTESIIIEKAATDTLTGSGMLAAPIAYKY
jgi:hypothetical protein